MRREADRALRASFQRLVRSAGLLDGTRTPCGVPVSPARAHALMFLIRQERGKRSPKQRELQRAIGIDKSNVSRLVGHMIDDGQVIETVCARDGRARRVSLTAAGRRIARELERTSLERFTEILGALAPDDRTRIPAALDRLADAMETIANKEPVP